MTPKSLMNDLLRTLAWPLQSLASTLTRRLPGDRIWVRRVVDALLLPVDIIQITLMHAQARGRPPALLRPRTYEDWMQRNKLFNRQPRHIRMADKITARDHVAERLGPDHAVPLLWTGQDIDDAPFNSLPSKFVIKANHGSGQFLVVRDKATLDRAELRKITADWLALDYSRKFAEWQYRWIRPSLLIERFVEPRDPERPAEYFFWCVWGRCVFVGVNTGTKTDRWERQYFDRDFTPIEVESSRSRPSELPVISPNYAWMLDAAERLAADEHLMRVDFFDADPPVVGELTLSPGAGWKRFEPDSWNDRLGALIARGRSSGYAVQ